MNEIDLIALLRNTGAVTRFVLAVLLIFSIWSWGIILSKSLLLRKVQGESETFWKIFRKGQSLSEISTASETLRFTPLVPVFNAGKVPVARGACPKDGRNHFHDAPTDATTGCGRAVDPARKPHDFFGDHRVGRAVRGAVRNSLGRHDFIRRLGQCQCGNTTRRGAGHRRCLDRNGVRFVRCNSCRDRV